MLTKLSLIIRDLCCLEQKAETKNVDAQTYPYVWDLYDCNNPLTTLEIVIIVL